MKRIYDIISSASSMATLTDEALGMKRIKVHLSKYLQEMVFAGVFLLVTLIIFRGYFLGENIPGSDAMGLPSMIEAARYNGSFFSQWATLVGMGYADYQSPVYPMVFMLASGLGMSSLEIAKGFMMASFWLSGTLMFFCMKRLSFGNVAALAAAAVFCFNQPFLSQITEGHYYFVLSYAPFPIVFLVFYRILSGQTIKHVYLVPAIILLFGVTAPPNIVIIALIFLILFSIFYRIVNPFPNRRWVYLVTASFLILAFTGMSVFLASGAQVYDTSYPIQEAYRWSSPSILDGLTLSATENSYFGGESIGHWVWPSSLDPLASVLVYVIPILAFSSLMFKKYRRETVPLALISVVLIILAKGPNEPWSWLFTWVFGNVPFFDTIRVFSRFSMFTAFTYGLMIAYLIIGLESRRPAADRSAWSRLRSFNLVPIVAILVPVCLILPSSVMVSDQVSGYDLPTAYAEPFEWVSEQNGDFRVLYLPNLLNYYNDNRSDGYPNTTTLDPGYYSYLYTHKDSVFGHTTYDEWYYLDRAVRDKKLGHVQVPQILADTASTRFIVAQAYAEENDTEPYMNLEGLDVVKTLDGGAIILENSEWSPRASAYSQFSLVTGGREALTTLAGMHLYNTSSEALVFMDQLDRSQTLGLLDQASHIYVYNGDMMSLMTALSPWESGQLKDLYLLGTPNTNDTKHNWVSTNWPVYMGYTLNPTLYTTGRTSFSVTIEPTAAGPNDLYLKLLKGIGMGNLTIEVPGMSPQVIDTSYADYQMAWVKIPLQNLTGPTTITITNDGEGANYIEQLLVASQEEMDQKMDECRSLLGDNLEKLVYVYMGTGYFNSTLHVLGGEGWGVASPVEGGELSLTVQNLSAGHQYLQVYNIEHHEASASLNGVDLASVNSTLRGTVYDLGKPDPGGTISIQTTGMYGAALFTGEWQEAAQPQATVTYSRSSSDTYRVNISSDQPVVLQISESYSLLWKGQTNGSELTHIPINSMVNGYLVGAGDHEVTVEFQGKTMYMLITGALAASLIATTAALWFFNRRPRG